MMSVPTAMNGFYRSYSRRWLGTRLASMDLLEHPRFSLGRRFLICSYPGDQQPRQDIRRFLQVADLPVAHYEIGCWIQVEFGPQITSYLEQRAHPGRGLRWQFTDASAVVGLCTVQNSTNVTDVTLVSSRFRY